MGSIGFAFTYTERDSNRIDRQHEIKFKEYTEEAKRIQQADQMKEKQKKMAHQAELASSLLEKVPRSFLLAELTNSLPPGVSLVDFALDSRRRQAAPTAPTVVTAFEQKKAAGTVKDTQVEVKLYDVGMRVTGVAVTDVQVAQLITRLNTSPLMKDVNLVISDQFEQDGDQLRKFVIELTLDPTAEIRPNEMDARKTTATVEMINR
jgi:hypothetical protein